MACHGEGHDLANWDAMDDGGGQKMDVAVCLPCAPGKVDVHEEGKTCKNLRVSFRSSAHVRTFDMHDGNRTIEQFGKERIDDLIHVTTHIKKKPPGASRQKC